MNKIELQDENDELLLKVMQQKKEIELLKEDKIKFKELAKKFRQEKNEMIEAINTILKYTNRAD